MKIAFCFLLTYSFPMEKIWERFFKNAKDRYIIIIHAKPGIVLETDFFKVNAHIIPPIETKWGDISLVIAQNLMLKYATINELADFCCILSGNCIPVKDFKYIYRDLDNLPTSRLHVIESPFFKLQYKHSQWCVLSLEHIQVILKYEDKYLRFFEEISFTEIDTLFGAPDEYFYVTLLYGQNIDNFIKSGCTYSKWNTATHMGHPKEYDNISIRKLIKLENSNYYFCRKILKKCKIQDDGRKIIDVYEPFKRNIVCDIEMKEI